MYKKIILFIICILFILNIHYVYASGVKIEVYDYTGMNQRSKVNYTELNAVNLTGTDLYVSNRTYANEYCDKDNTTCGVVSDFLAAAGTSKKAVGPELENDTTSIGLNRTWYNENVTDYINYLASGLGDNKSMNQTLTNELYLTVTGTHQLNGSNHSGYLDTNRSQYWGTVTSWYGEVLSSVIELIKVVVDGLEAGVQQNSQQINDTNSTLLVKINTKLNLTGGNVTGDIEMPAGVWFRGLFNWTDISKYLSFDGANLDFIEAELNATVLDLTSSTTYNASSINLTFGTLDAGNLSSIFVAKDDDTFNISESAGADALLVVINFTSVEKFTSMLFRLHYIDSSHTIAIGLWDCDDSSYEEEYGVISSSDDFEFISISVFDAEDHVCGGNVSLRFRHVNVGNTGHDLILDYIVLIDGFSTTTNVDHDSGTGRNNFDNNHPLYSEGITDLRTDNVTIFARVDANNLSQAENDTAQADLINGVRDDFDSSLHTNVTDANILAVSGDHTNLTEGDISALGYTQNDTSVKFKNQTTTGNTSFENNVYGRNCFVLWNETSRFSICLGS